jgi:hypothetical protein
MSIWTGVQVISKARRLRRDMRAGVLRGWRVVDLDDGASAVLDEAYDDAVEFVMDAAQVELRLEASVGMTVYVGDTRVGRVDATGLEPGAAHGRLVRHRWPRPRRLLLVRVSGSRVAPLDELFDRG